MAWSYDSTNLNTDTMSGRLNVIRLLLGDTSQEDQKLQDEEVLYYLGWAGNNVYAAASEAARSLASKYASMVDVTLDSAVTVKYSTLATQYTNLAVQLDQQSLKVGAKIGVAAGGLSAGVFSRDRFKNPLATDTDFV